MCYGDVAGPTFPGRDPSELDALFKRVRYRELLRLIDRLKREGGSGSPSSAAALTKIRAWLDQRSGDPSIMGGPSDARLRHADRVMHLTALSMLGDAEALARLYEIVDEPANSRADPWVAARWAVEYGLPGAADHAAVRLLWGRDHRPDLSYSASKYRMDDHGSDTVRTRGDLLVTEVGALVDAMAAAGDPRFALGLLQRSGYAMTVAVQHIARLPSPEVCTIVSDAAARADAEVVLPAFWALSVLGDTCKPQMKRLAASAAQPEGVRRAAVLLLAMMRDKEAEALTARPPVAWSRYGSPAAFVTILLHARE